MINIKIIISPAKTMKIDNDAFVHRQMPVFIEKTQGLLDYLKELSYEELKSVWKCSDKLAKQNFDRIKDMDLYNNLTPAILSFEGLQYKYMAAGVFSYEELDYIEEHLRILSGFYGVLRPSDGIVIEKSTLIKMARGEMVRFMAENNIKNIQGIKKFDRLDYHYRENLSDDKTYVFIKGES